MDPRIQTLMPTFHPSVTAAPRRAPTGFRDHLARGLAVASDVAGAVGAVVPGAGAVGLALSGLSRVVGGAAPSETTDLSSFMEETRAFNTRYLMMQEQMQRESRVYTALSNIMRVRHEAAKNALGNIR